MGIDPQNPIPAAPAAPAAAPAAPAAAPAAPTTPAAPAKPAAPGENSTIRTMREAITAKDTENAELQRQLAEAQGKVTDADRKDLEELDRTKLERDDALGKLKEHDDTKTELAALSTAMEASYKTRLEAVDEKHRTNVEELSEDGNWADRLKKLDNAVALLPTPQSVGSSGSPSAPAAPEPAVPGTPAVAEPLGPEGLKKIAAQDGSIAPHLMPRADVAAARARAGGNTPTVVRPQEAAGK